MRSLPPEVRMSAMIVDLAAPGIGQVVEAAYKRGLLDGADEARKIFEAQGLITTAQAEEALRQHIRDNHPNGQEMLEARGLDTPRNPLADIRDVPDFPNL